jgi:hypothetical protein
MRRPGDDTPEPPGGRAAERLREHLQDRLPQTGGPGTEARCPKCGEPYLRAHELAKQTAYVHEEGGRECRVKRAKRP